MGVPRRLVSLLDKTFSSPSPLTSKDKTHISKMAKGAGSKKAKKSGSNVFAMFSQRQIQEFKEAFGIMDCNKDGILNADDLVGAFSAVGKSISSGEADAMLSEAPGPVNFTQMVMLLPKKWPAVPMMTTPSSNPLKHSKSTARLTQKCSNTPCAHGATNSPPAKLTRPFQNSKSTVARSTPLT